MKRSVFWFDFLGNKILDLKTNWFRRKKKPSNQVSNLKKLNHDIISFCFYTIEQKFYFFLLHFRNIFYFNKGASKKKAIIVRKFFFGNRPPFSKATENMLKVNKILLRELRTQKDNLCNLWNVEDNFPPSAPLNSVYAPHNGVRKTFWQWSVWKFLRFWNFELCWNPRNIIFGKLIPGLLLFFGEWMNAVFELF